MSDFSSKGCPITAFERSLLVRGCGESDWVAVWVELMQRIGVEPIVAIMDEFGSEKIHVPTRESFFGALWRAMRDAEVRRRLAAGDSASVIAHDFGLSRALVYVIKNKDNAADAVLQRRVVKGGP
ncbi:MAG TPA: hypothetical protein PLR28_03895 [Dokdonella sp.]|nr:hypothetical protein [Dokdonella sp.]